MLRLLERLLADALTAVLKAKADKEARQAAELPASDEPPPAAPVTVKKQLELHLFFLGPHGIRNSLFGGRMTSAQVAGCERIIKAFETYRPQGTLEQLAYILATSYHETGRRMQPVREAFGTSTNDTIVKLDRAWANGQLRWVRAPYWRDGWFGRGDVQLTHKANYTGPLAEAVHRRFGVWLVREPDLALDPQISAYILIEGMFRGDTGLADFTSHALEDFVNETRVDYYGARRVVNPGDLSTYTTIATYAKNFEKALRSAGYEPAQR